MDSSKLFFKLHKDMAMYLSKYLSAPDVVNMYRAGRYITLFVERYYLKNGYLMLAQIEGKEKIKEFTCLFKFLSEVLYDATLHFDKQMIYLKEMYQSKTVLIDLKLKNKFFGQYWCCFDLFSRINIKTFLKLISMKRVDNLTFGISIDDFILYSHNRLSITSYDSSSGMKISKQLYTLDLEKNNIQFSLPKFDAIVSIDKNLWDSIIENLNIRRLKYVEVKIDHKTLVFSSDDDYYDDFSNGINIIFDKLNEPNKNISFKLKPKEKIAPIIGRFRLDFLKGYWRWIKTENPIKLSIKRDYLLMLELDDPNLEMMIGIKLLKH